MYVVVYCPPLCDTASFFKFLEQLLSFANDAGCRVVLGGDVNIDSLEQRNCSVGLPLLLLAHCFHNVVAHPTCITPSSLALFNLFITNCNSSNITSGMLVSDMSDHLLIYMHSLVGTE